jgi:hypothetical protein
MIPLECNVMFIDEVDVEIVRQSCTGSSMHRDALNRHGDARRSIDPGAGRISTQRWAKVRYAPTAVPALSTVRLGGAGRTVHQATASPILTRSKATPIVAR